MNEETNKETNEVTYRVERIQDIRDEMTPLITPHWEEVALNKAEIPLDVDWDWYGGLQDAGVLHCTTARADGKLVGYALFIVSGSLRYRGLRMAENDVFYLAPEYRRGLEGARLFKAAEAHLKAKGCTKMLLKTKLHKDLDVLFRRLGFKPIERYYSKLI